MKEEQKLLHLDLEKEQQKKSLNHAEGISLFFFRALYQILKLKGFNYFCDMLFTIGEFIQLMAFPMDKVFSSGWKNYWYGSIGSFFRYFHLISLWRGNSQIYLITYILSILYILSLLILFIHLIIKSTSLSYKSHFSARILSLLLDFETILSIPFLRTLFAAFTCENNILQIAPSIKCKTGFHIGILLISIIFSIIYIILIAIFVITLFEFGPSNEKMKAAYCSSTEIMLRINIFILIIVFQFIKNEMVLSIITFIMSLIIFFDFINKQPFSNGFTMKLYFLLYFLFFYSSTICLISLLLKNTKFEGGIVLLIIGYPIIIISISMTESDFSFDKIFQFLESKERDGYKALLEIEYFLKMEDNIEDKIRTKEQKILYSYIAYYEKNCSLENCPLKQFLNIPLKIENFVEMKICLLQHGEVLFKNAVTKFPFNAKLRLSYGLFLYKKLNKKLKGTTEITLLNKYNTNLEDSFLIYKAQRYIQEENDGFSSNIKANKLTSERNANEVNSITYKFTINNIKNLIGKITMYYIDFWTILAISDENKTDNFQKMSKIGTKISKLNGELKENIEKLEEVNLYDQETFKLYIQYLNEILSDNTQANIYINKLIENENRKHHYNEENLFELNYKEMSKSEDYKYIVINCSHSNFDVICNLSLGVIPIFGYTKDELIGHPYHYLLPELFSDYHKTLLENKVDEFKKKLLIKNAKYRSESWIEQCFGKNKMKYLVPIKTKWTLVSSEEEIIYAIGRIYIDYKIAMEIEQEVIYILTNKNLIIQNFTSNAPKFLYLHSSAINNNLDITDFIKEFSEDYAPNTDNYDDIMESNISNISIDNTKKKKKNLKLKIIKNLFLKEKDSKKVINWRLGDIITNEINKGKKNGKRISRFQSALTDINGKNLKYKIKVKPKRKISVGENEYFNFKQLNSSHTEDKLPIFESEKMLDIKELNISDIIDDNNEKTYKEKVYYHRPIHQKFTLSIKEIKYNDLNMGYLFIFEPFFSKKLKDANLSINKNNQIFQKHEMPIITKQENNEMEKSEISVVSFTTTKQNLENVDKRNSIINNTPDNPFGIQCANDDTFFLNINKEKENEFTINMCKMTYKQIGINVNSEELNLYEELKKEAVEKISNLAKQVKKEEISEEEEEESSSGSDYPSEEESSKNTSDFSSDLKMEERTSIQSIKDINSKDNRSLKNENNANNDKSLLSIRNSNIPNINISPSQKTNNANISQINPINTSNIANKHKEDDYYHVDVSKITFYIYNFSTGFVESLKDQKYKISQIVKQINTEKEKLSRMNAKYISNPKLAKEKKRGNINKKISNDSNEYNFYNEQSIKLKEIQKVLSSKEKQTTIINLFIFSFIIFALILGSSIMSIMINYYLKDRIFLFYSLMKKSIELYKNILLEISFVREMLIINSTYYNNNFYDDNKTRYFSNYSELCNNYYLDTSLIISNITTNIHSLNEKSITLISNKTIYCYIIDPNKSHELRYFPKRYELPLFSAYRELNTALYHIAHLKMEDIYTYEENIYYFLKNGMSNLIINSEEQIKLLSNEFYHIIKFGFTILIICFCVLFAIYIGCYLMFYHFYEKVEEKKQNYLSVFNEINGQFIVLSLSKCEKFSLKLQLQEDILGGQVDKAEKMSLDSSSFDESELDNDFQTSLIIKQNKENKINSTIKEKKSKNNYMIKMKIIGFIIFFFLLLCQYSSYVYYYLRISLYENCMEYGYHLNSYFSSFLYPFIVIREFIYDSNKTFYNIPVHEYIDEILKKFYINLAQISNNKDEYEKYFPDSYRVFLNNLYSEGICELIDDFIKEYPNNGFINVEDFFYGSSEYSFFTILTIYIEEIRMIRDSINDYSKSKPKHFIYNESFYNDPNGYYDILYNNYNGEELDNYKKFNPANVLNSVEHKNILIAYRFIISKVLIIALNQMFTTFENIFDNTNRVSLIINIVFILVVVLGFSLIWIPFVLEQNEIIFKTKNMLSIIPNDVLITLPHINIMLGIDDENN